MWCSSFGAAVEVAAAAFSSAFVALGGTGLERLVGAASCPAAGVHGGVDRVGECGAFHGAAGRVNGDFGAHHQPLGSGSALQPFVQLLAGSGGGGVGTAIAFGGD